MCADIIISTTVDTCLASTMVSYVLSIGLFSVTDYSDDKKKELIRFEKSTADESVCETQVDTQQQTLESEVAAIQDR